MKILGGVRLPPVGPGGAGLFLTYRSFHSESLLVIPRAHRAFAWSQCLRHGLFSSQKLEQERQNMEGGPEGLHLKPGESPWAAWNQHRQTQV